MKHTSGFTLIEILVVVSIIAILSGGVIFSVGEAGQQSRDADRKADLKTLQTAIEQYKLRHGRYPAGCKGPGVWSGQIGTSHACPGSSHQFIVGHTTSIKFSPDFIRTIPQDKKLNGADSGYVYTTNTDGTVYKLEAKNTVESEVVDYNNPLKSCDATDSATGICDATHPLNNKPNHCQESNVLFQKSLAVWGGFANNSNASLVERYTEDVICDVQ